MIWNIEFQCAALVIAMVVAGICFGQKRLNLAAERAYVRLLFVVVICIILDILSVFAINYRSVIGENLCIIACKAYLLSITMVGCQSAWFAVAEVRYTFKKFWVDITAAPILVELIFLILFPIEIYAEDGKLYTYGIPDYATYFFCFLYIVASFIMTVVLRKRISLKRRMSIYFWLICWVSVATLQFFVPNLLLVSFAMAVAVMYIYCKLENPEYHLDFATSVFNKKAFSMVMGEHLSFSEKYSIVTFKIKGMGMVNEIFGATAVEKLILAISEFADGIPNSTLFRIEDNLFCLTVASNEEAEKALDQIIRRFNQPWEVNGASIDIEVSLSFIKDISIFNDADDIEEVVRYFGQESVKLNHDEVLYVNDKELKERAKGLEMQKVLEWAFRNNGIEVYFQPIYSIEEGKFVALEALARIKNKDGSIIMPADFIEFAERNGMILKLGETVFRKTCEFIQRMHVEQYGIKYIEVNLSVVQCMQDDMARTLKNIMGEYQIRPDLINFEITETAAISSQKTIENNMQEIIKYGSGFSLDDYGSGYSNLSYVVTLPLKIIKIDKAMVDAYFISDKVKTATEYTIEMLHKLGMQIIVEGVETEDQYMAFKKLGVEFIQGYYFSVPLPKNKVLNYIQEWL